ncbi:transferase [Streptomyces sp. NPDC050256]|uniref:transferase n=1 Tax=Streptomyces sp. NPDC050256 TaxID=3365607 RepID=UPI003799C02B
MSSRLWATARLITTVAIVTVYVALHLVISAGMDLRARDRFSDGTIRAAAFTAMLDRYGAGDMSARAEIRSVNTWFKENAPAGASRSTVSLATVDVESGRISLARERSAGLAADTLRDRKGLERRLGSSRETALYWAVAAVVLLGPTMWLRRRRRSGAAEIVRVVSRFDPPHPWWRRPVFLLASSVGYVLLVAGFITVSTAQRRGHEMSPLRLMLSLVGGLAVFGAAVLILRYTRPRSVRGAARALLADGRQPVLYLRSFADDDVAAQVDDSGSFISLHSREEQFTAALGAVGPVITVGRPGEPLPRLGAARFYLPLDDWQPTILRLMALSQLCVLRLGSGEGLWWEVQQARATQAARKIVLLVPGGLPEVAQRLEEHLPSPCHLAEVTGDDPWTGAVITFAPDWTPQVHRVGPSSRAPLPRAALIRRAARSVRAGYATLMMHTPAHHLARAGKDALASMGVRKRTMTWRSAFATQRSLWTGFVLVAVLLLLAWLAVRALQLLGRG